MVIQWREAGYDQQVEHDRDYRYMIPTLQIAKEMVVIQACTKKNTADSTLNFAKDKKLQIIHTTFFKKIYM